LQNSTFRKYQFKRSSRTYLIEEDLPEVGWYLYEFDESGKCVADYLQDSLEVIMAFATEQFSIQKESWHRIE